MVEFLLIVLALIAWRISTHLFHVRAHLDDLARSNRALSETITEREFLLSEDEVPRSRGRKRELRPPIN